MQRKMQRPCHGGYARQHGLIFTADVKTRLLCESSGNRQRRPYRMNSMKPPGESAASDVLP